MWNSTTVGSGTIFVAALVAGPGCGSTPEPPSADEPQDATPIPVGEVPPHARLDLVEGLATDLERVRHASDGAGRAWLESGGPAVAGEPGRWTLVYEAGPLGIAEGGVLFLQVSPFWGWSTPQTVAADAPGYTVVELVSEARGLVLEPATLADQLLGITIGGRALEAGEQVRIVYGAGSAGAVADSYAEHGSQFWFQVDGDGDGVRGVLGAPPMVEVGAGPPWGAVATLPSTAEPGDEVEVVVAVLDRFGNAFHPWAGTLALRSDSDGLQVPEQVELSPEDGGAVRVTAQVLAPGIHRVKVFVSEDVGFGSNPLFAAPGAPAVYWGDLHGHSNLSDGTGTPEDYYRFARDVAALDFASLTDHDHWGIEFLDQHPEIWSRIQEATDASYQPGRFVTVLGYEWTSWIHGHRHVLFFDGSGEVYSSMDPRFDTPIELYEALRGRDALVVAHHSAGGPIAVDWSLPPDPVLEPVTEVSSVHGQSEAMDGPHVLYSPVPGNFVRDQLDRGYQLGFVGSGDSHDGHPGLAHLTSGQGGLLATVGAERTREGLLAALRSRRVYATNGPRIVLFATLGGHPMGSILAAQELDVPDLVVAAFGSAPVEAVDVIRSGQVSTHAGVESAEVHLEHQVEGLSPGEYLYVRVRQADGGVAWSSPFFVVGP